MYNGFTRELPPKQKMINEYLTVTYYFEKYPGNHYWMNRLNELHKRFIDLLLDETVDDETRKMAEHIKTLKNEITQPKNI